MPSALDSEEPLGFDLLILADLLFNHSEHTALVSSVHSTLKRNSKSKALVFFTPYRPWLLEKDMAFFKLAVDAGFKVEKIWEEVLDAPMFEKDPGVSIASLCCGNSENWYKQATDIRIRNRMNYSGERSSDTSFDGQREISRSIDHPRSAYHVTLGKNHVSLSIACEDMHRNSFSSSKDILL